MEGGKAKGERRGEGKPNERSDALPSRLAKIQEAIYVVSSRDGCASPPWGLRHPVAVLGAINLAQTRRQRLPAVLAARSMAMRASASDPLLCNCVR